MIRAPRQRDRDAVASATLHQKINDRTSARIIGLRVEVSARGVLIAGQAPSFHVKQLALAACHQFLGASSLTRLNCEIEVWL
jgi:hypothetical protein